MSAAKHTPGPWRIDPLDDSFKSHGWRVSDQAGLEVALVYSNAPRNDEEAQVATEADARLIAAAPDMLQALNDVSSYFDSLREEEGYLTPKWLVGVRAAIAKAKGGA